MYGDQQNAKAQLIEAAIGEREIPVHLVARAVVELENKLEAVALATLQSITRLAEATMTLDAKLKFSAAMSDAIRHGE